MLLCVPSADSSSVAARGGSGGARARALNWPHSKAGRADIMSSDALARIGGKALPREIGETEKNSRIELAAAFRIAHHFGWNYDTLNHITLRLPGTETFLINPLGLGWDEITASSLATADYEGRIASHTGVKLAPAGFNFHSGILKARPDINCVLHVHEAAGAVIGSLEEGLDRLQPERLRLTWRGRLSRFRRPGARRRRSAAHPARSWHQAHADHDQSRAARASALRSARPSAICAR